jgi:hypothetical protein
MRDRRSWELLVSMVPATIEPFSDCVTKAGGRIGGGLRGIMSDILPAIFFGHGNPMNALSTNPYTDGWRRIGEQTPRPRVILSISAHWFVSGPTPDHYLPLRYVVPAVSQDR